MASLKLLLGFIPSTSKIEQAEKALTTEFDKMQVFSGSEELAKYNKLNGLINSSDFIQKKKDIESLQYKGSEECSKEKEFIALQKAKDIVLYLDTVSGNALKQFKALENSDKIKKLEDLEKLVKSDSFKEKEKQKSDEFKGTEEYKKSLEYKSLKENEEIKNYYKFVASKEYGNYKALDGSQRLLRYNELKEYISSEEFRKRKEYLLDKKRFEKTEMFKDIQEYNSLKKNEDIIWYFKTKDSNKFDILRHRELIFSDEFDGEKLDTKKWITNYYWGDKLLKDRFSVESDLQAFTEKDNFQMHDSVLKIITKPQKITGKVWSAAQGFSTKEFNYTSGIINSGDSFRHKYGIFQAKVKLGDANAKNAFWMLADKIKPHIDICHTSKGKVWFDFFSSNGTETKTSLGSRYSNDFFIYTLEWTAEKLVWKINNTEVFTQTSNVPQEPMYILFSGGLDKPINGTSEMEIDWVRVYQPKN
jgi:hypothetical protein